MGLFFATPLLLAGIAAVAVPIALHMMMRRKPVKLEFPALRFLQQRNVVNRRRLRLRHLLLLLARIAAIVLFVLALSRPTIKGAGWLGDAEGPLSAVFLFDTAPRMEYREGNRTRLDEAKSLAREVIEKLPVASRVAIVDTSDGVAVFSPTITAAKAHLERLETGMPARSLVDGMSEAFRMLEASELPRKEMYVFTDLTNGAFPGDSSPRNVQAQHPSIPVLVVDVGVLAAEDFALGAVYIPNDRIAVGMPLRLSVATGRLGPDEDRSVAIELATSSGQYTRRAQQRLSWKSSTPTSAQFELTGLPVGVQQGRVLIEGSDALEADDERYFTVEVGAPWRVLVAAPFPAARTGLFLTEAIAPTTLKKAGTSRFDVKLIDLKQLVETAWDGFDAIVLVDPPAFPDRTWELLRDWIGTGKGLVTWLGPHAGDPLVFNTPASQTVLGAKLVRVWRSPDASNFMVLSSLDHPMVSAFRRVADSVGWEDFPVNRHWEIESIGLPPESDVQQKNPRGAQNNPPVSSTVVAQWRNGFPAIIEHPLGKGWAVVVTTPVSQAADDPQAWNILATGFEPWPFVMLANESVLYSIDRSERRNVITGNPASIRIDREGVTDAFVKTPKGDEFPVPVDIGKKIITVTATQEAGNYSIRAGAENDGIATGLSANFPTIATDVSRLSPELIVSSFAPEQRFARSEKELVRDVNLERIGAELFGWLIVLAAGAIVLDWWLANRFYAERDDTSQSASSAKDQWSDKTNASQVDQNQPSSSNGISTGKDLKWFGIDEKEPFVFVEGYSDPPPVSPQSGSVVKKRRRRRE